MNKEKVIAKITKNLKSRKLFILSDKCITYKNINTEGDYSEAKKASFFIEAGDTRHEVNYDEEGMDKSDKYKFFIFPLSKYRVAVKDQTVDKGENQWLIGGFDSDNDNMKILGYMDFGAVSVMIYFNSETETPFIMLEDWMGTGIPELMYQALCSLGFEKGKEGEEEFEEEFEEEL